MSFSDLWVSTVLLVVSLTAVDDFTATVEAFAVVDEAAMEDDWLLIWASCLP